MAHRTRQYRVKLNDGDIRRLHIFCTVVRCGGFAAAESELQIGLPSISRYMKDLEIRLGTRLCRRGRVGFELTEQGRRVYAASLQLTADLKQFENSINTMHSGLAGALTIGVIDTLITDPQLCLPTVFADYQLRHPLVEFNLQTTTTNAIEQAVMDGGLDAGFIIARRHLDPLEYRLMYEETQNLYCSERHPLYDSDIGAVTLEQIAQCHYAGYSFFAEADRSGPAAALTRTGSADSVEAMALLVSSGCFCGMLPDHYVNSVWRLRNFKAIRPDIFGVSNQIELIVRRGASTPLVAAFIECVEGASALSTRSVNGGRPRLPAPGLHRARRRQVPVKLQ